MKAKRFFLLLIFIIQILFLCSNKITINAASNEINEEIATSFIHKAGRYNSLLLSNENIVYGWGLWGDNNDVSFSRKIKTPTDITSSIEKLEGEEFIDIFAGEQHCFITSNKSRVFAMGSGKNKQLGYSDYYFKSKPVDITSMFCLSSNESIDYIACSDDFNIALTSNKRILSFGKNEDGQLGILPNTQEAVVYDITNNFNLQEGDYIVDVQCGASHSLALSNNGYVYVWGSSFFYQLGFNSQETIYTPTHLNVVNETIVKIACGRYSSYMLTNQSQLYGFGSDSFGQLASCSTILTSNVKKTPYLMNGSFKLEHDEYIKDIYAGYYYAIVKTNLNNFYSFGQNTSGQLANNSTISTSVPYKIEYESLLTLNDEIVDISCGEQHCLATTKYGKVLSWGSNLYGQLSEDYSVSSSNSKIIDITYNFPPIVLVSINSSSVLYKDYTLDINVYYLDNEKIEETYYSISDNLITPNSNWVQFNDYVSVKDYEGKIYVHLKIVSKKGTYYHVCNALLLDHVIPLLTLKDKNNEIFSDRYTNSTIFVNAIDNNDTVEIVYYLNGKKHTTSSNTISLSQDGNYQIYAKDEANNVSATIEFTIDTILPTITKIEHNIFTTSSYSTRESEITIQGSEALSCYKLGYKGVKDDSYIALNDNEDLFKVKLKKGVNTLTLIDLAGNESITYEIIYSPRFFQDTQLLLLVFSTCALLFIATIIIVYVIRAKRKLIK